jgi:predicted RNase H-like nuclease
MFAGVDACKGGWIVAKAATWPCRKIPCLAVCQDFRGVLEFAGNCERVAVDIPIGLPSSSHIRLCDLEAKKMLAGHNPAALFFAPPHETISAKTPDEFQMLYRRACGKGAGLPVWGFLPKVRDANQSMNPFLQRRVVEFHPELAWMRLAGRTLESKHTQEGVAERKKLLREVVPELECILRWKDRLGRCASLDDILDAFVGISVAKASLHDSSHHLPYGSSEFDKAGLRMEIWY